MVRKDGEQEGEKRMEGKGMEGRRFGCGNHPSPVKPPGCPWDDIRPRGDREVRAASETGAAETRVLLGLGGGTSRVT